MESARGYESAWGCESKGRECVGIRECVGEMCCVTRDPLSTPLMLFDSTPPQTQLPTLSMHSATPHLLPPPLTSPHLQHPGGESGFKHFLTGRPGCRSSWYPMGINQHITGKRTFMAFRFGNQHPIWSSIEQDIEF